jgi:hypothetical protein
MPRRLAIPTFGLALATASALHGAQAGPAPDVTYDGARLSVSVPDARPLQEVIEAIGAAMGAETVVRRDPGTVGPVEVGPAPPGEVLREIVGKNSLAITYWSPGDAAAHRGDARPGEVRRIIVVGRDPRGPATAPVVDSKLGDRPMPPKDPVADPPPPGQPSDPMRRLLRRVAELGGGQGSAEDVLELEEAYYAGQSLELRRAVLVSLSRLNTPETLALIERLGLGDADPEVRLFAARALHRADPAYSRAILSNAAAAESDPDVRREMQALLSTR